MRMLLAARAFFKANWLPILIGAAVIYGLYRVDQNGFNRAKDQAEAAEMQRKAMEARLTHKVETQMSHAITEIDRRSGDRLDMIDTEERTIVMPTLTKEITRDPRYSDPACSLTDGVRDSLNRARRASAASSPGETAEALPSRP